MAIPVLYWMLECIACGARLVVHDSYLKFVSTSDPKPMPGTGYGGPPLPERYTCTNGCVQPMKAIGSIPMPGTGYGGPPLPERYTCTNGCVQPMKAIGSIFEPEDKTMWLYEPHVRVRLTKAQSEEWRQLIEASGLAEGVTSRITLRRPWWRIW